MACEPVTSALHRPPAMTGCACAEVAFRDVAGRMRAEGLSFEEACRRSGVGLLCTACIPDLREFLRRALAAR